jgi:hypothetical protein
MMMNLELQVETMLMVMIMIQILVVEMVVAMHNLILLQNPLDKVRDLHHTPAAAQGEQMKDPLVILLTNMKIKRTLQRRICPGKGCGVKTIPGIWS